MRPIKSLRVSDETGPRTIETGPRTIETLIIEAAVYLQILWKHQGWIRRSLHPEIKYQLFQCIFI